MIKPLETCYAWFLYWRVGFWSGFLFFSSHCHCSCLNSQHEFNILIIHHHLFPLAIFYVLEFDVRLAWRFLCYDSSMIFLVDKIISSRSFLFLIGITFIFIVLISDECVDSNTISRFTEFFWSDTKRHSFMGRRIQFNNYWFFFLELIHKNCSLDPFSFEILISHSICFWTL